jgi:hypothetical protein
MELHVLKRVQLTSNIGLSCLYLEKKCKLYLNILLAAHFFSIGKSVVNKRFLEKKSLSYKITRKNYRHTGILFLTKYVTTEKSAIYINDKKIEKYNQHK